MPESDKRIVVDGVEFAHLFEFPKILRAVTLGLQPPRLVLGLLMVAALLTVGRIWDDLSKSTVPAEGLTAEVLTPQQARDSQAVLREAIQSYVTDDADWPPGEPTTWQLQADEVLPLIEAGYWETRQELLADADGSDEAATAKLQLSDQRYLRALERIEQESTKPIFKATVSHVTASFQQIMEAVVSFRLSAFFAAAGDLFVRTPVSVWRHDRLFAVVYGLLLVLVTALAGGALSRMTAVEVARGQKLRLQEALDFALSNWRRLIFSLLLPLMIAGGLCVLLFGGGWLLMLPWLDVLGGLLYGIALVFGLGVVFLLIGYAAGFSLLVPAVACEKCDAADAQQRAYAYVLSRPLHLLGYGVVGLVGLALGFVVVSLFAAAMLNVTGALVDTVTANAAVAETRGFSLFDLTPSRAAIPVQGHSELSAWFVSFWQTVVVCLVAGYVFSYYFGASTIVYLLMRRACDGQDVAEIWQPGDLAGTAVPEPGTSGGDAIVPNDAGAVDQRMD